MEQTPDRNIWDRVLGKIETRVNAHSFKTWFRPTHLVSEDDAEPARPRSELVVRGVAAEPTTCR